MTKDRRDSNLPADDDSIAGFMFAETDEENTTQADAIRQRDQLTARLRASRERYRDLFDNASDVIYTHDLDGIITSANRAAARTFGYTKRTLVGLDVREIVLEDYLPRLLEHAGDFETGPYPTTPFEIMAQSRQGVAVWIEVNPRLVREDGEPVGVHIIARDITARKDAEHTIRHQAFHDSLTGLANRRLFADRVRLALANAERNGDHVAVLFLDLDRFKLINDGLGHETGDLLLQRVADRLQGVVREADTVGRRGGDEFTILVPDLVSPDDAAITAHRVLEDLRNPAQCGEHQVHITTSIGISVYPRDGEAIEDLVRHADIAMYRAKSEGRGNYQFYRADMNTRARERIEMESTLRAALRYGGLSLEFQPRVRLSDGKVAALEALVRVRGADGGLIKAEEFVPVAVESGLIGPIGQWVINQVCELIAESGAGQDAPHVIANVSERECLHGDIVATVADAIGRTGADPDCLELDLSHGFAANEAVEARDVIAELARMGVRLGLDNFGTATTSIRTLRVPHLHTLTIDREYMAGLPHDSRDCALVESIIDMGHRLGVEVVGFGVEDPRQLTWLAEAGCDYAQGLACGAPVTAEEARRMLSGG